MLVQDYITGEKMIETDQESAYSCDFSPSAEYVFCPGNFNSEVNIWEISLGAFIGTVFYADNKTMTNLPEFAHNFQENESKNDFMK